MEIKKFSFFAGKPGEMLKKHKYAFAVLVLGLLLMLLPSGGSEEEVKNESLPLGDFSLEEEEKKIEGALGKIKGVGEVAVVLTLDTSTQQVLAADTENSQDTATGQSQSQRDVSSRVEHVVIRVGGDDTAVAEKYIYPEYRGALVVAQGADSATVKLEIIQAVSGLTGLSADKITVAVMK